VWPSFIGTRFRLRSTSTSDGDHEIRVRVLDDEDSQVIEATFGWKVEPDSIAEGLPLPTLPLAVPAHIAHLKRYGQHRVVIELDGNQVDVLNFVVRLPDEELMGSS
jgi:hypothetical protein